MPTPSIEFRFPHLDASHNAIDHLRRQAWRMQMHHGLSEIADALNSAAIRGRLQLSDSCRRVAQRLVAGRHVAQLREPPAILADWRSVQVNADAQTAVPVREALSSALRAEYASSLLVRTGIATQLGSSPFATDSAAFQDPRAAELADELVSALWLDAGARARAAFFEPGTAAAEGARTELAELGDHIADLELALHERPWTEGY